MNRKQLITLLVAAALLAGVGALLYQRQNASWNGAGAGSGSKLLGEKFPVNDVQRLCIRQGSNQVNLVKQDDLWRVRERNDYPANFSEIAGFLLKARDLRAVQTDPVGPSQWTRLQLATDGQGTNAPTVVEFKGQNDQAITSLFLGKKYFRKSNQPSPAGEGGEDNWPAGRYVKVGADSKFVTVISDPLDGIEPRPELWLSKDFFRVEKPSSVEVTFPIATNNWKLTRETESGEWKLADAKAGEQLDASKAASVSGPLASPSFSDVLPGDHLGSGMNPPVVIRIGTFDHFAYTIKAGGKTNEDYFLTVTVSAQIPKEREPGKEEKPEEKTKLDQEFKSRMQKLEEKLKQEQSCSNWTYRVSGWTLEPLLKERSQLMAGKKEPSENGAPGSMPFSPGDPRGSGMAPPSSP